MRQHFRLQLACVHCESAYITHTTSQEPLQKKGLFFVGRNCISLMRRLTSPVSRAETKAQAAASCQQKSLGKMVTIS